MAQKNLSPKTTAIVLGTALVVVGILEINALQAKERAENPPRVIDGNTCFKCHNTPEELKKLRRKEGKSGFLFNEDGSPRDPNIVEYYRKQGSSYSGPSPHGNIYTQ